MILPRHIRQRLVAVVKVGAVMDSSPPNQRIACSRESPHMSSDGCSELHTAGRSGWPKMAQRRSAVNCTQGTPAGLPCGMPGMGLEMDGAVQQAAQWGRQFMVVTLSAEKSTA